MGETSTRSPPPPTAPAGQPVGHPLAEVHSPVQDAADGAEDRAGRLLLVDVTHGTGAEGTSA